MLFVKICKCEPIDRVCTFPCLNIALSYAKCSSALVYSFFLVMFRVSWNSWKVGTKPNWVGLVSAECNSG